MNIVFNDINVFLVQVIRSIVLTMCQQRFPKHVTSKLQELNMIPVTELEKKELSAQETWK